MRRGVEPRGGGRGAEESRTSRWDGIGDSYVGLIDPDQADGVGHIENFHRYEWIASQAATERRDWVGKWIQWAGSAGGKRMIQRPKSGEVNVDNFAGMSGVGRRNQALEILVDCFGVLVGGGRIRP